MNVPNSNLEQPTPAAPISLAEATPPTAAPQRPEPGWLGRTVAILVGLVVIALLVLLTYGLLRKQGGSFAGFAVNSVGKAAAITVRPAPDFGLQLFDGTRLRLSEQRGQVVLVNFWASWCPPCREEARTLEAAWRAYRERGVLVVGVDVWDEEADARAFLREFGITYPNGPDGNGEVLIEYGVTGIPETYFIGRDGQLVRRWIGPLSPRQIEAFIEELL